MSTVPCPNCGTPNASTAKFCSRCGARLIISTPPAGRTCPQCRTAVAVGVNFCPNCGYNMVGAPPPPAAPPYPAPSSAAAPTAMASTPPTPGLSAPGIPPAGVPSGPHATRMIGASGAAPTLVIRILGGAQQRVSVTKPVTTLGRAQDNDFRVDYATVSGHHLEFNLGPSGLTVKDVGSTNRTLLNNQMLEFHMPYPFQPSDVLRIGDLTGNSVSIVYEAEAGLSVRTLSLGQLDLSSMPNVIIGRDQSCYLPLNHPTVSFHHAMIFKMNTGTAIRDLGSTNGTFVNGKRILQVPLNSGDIIQIGPFRLTYDAQAQSLAQSIIKGHRLDALQLSREVAAKRGEKIWILKDVTTSVQPGDFVALVGGSGAGKSTLMKAMNGYEQATHGRMMIDGSDLYPQLDLYRSQMGYVPQDDIIHRELPVRLALWYSAKLRLPDYKPADIEARIDEVLKGVDMAEHQDKRVFKLSGGQRKRVSIAVELLASPTLFFLDEPTSGLDPGLEKKMMYDLNRLADEGRTVVLVTHATANIEQCDYVAFMSKGRLSYYGPPKEALSFFQVQDFSDIYQEIDRDVDPAKGKPPPKQLEPFYQQVAAQSGGAPKMKAGVLWAEKFRASPDYQKYVTGRQQQLGSGQVAGGAGMKPARAKDSFFRQAILLARRQFDLVRMDMRTLFILLLMMPFIALLFMVVSKTDALIGRGDKSLNTVKEELRSDALDEYAANPDPEDYDESDPDLDWAAEYKPYPEAKTLLIMLGLALTQAGTFGAAYEIVKERPIFKRERAVNLMVTAYVLSKYIVLALFAIVQVLSVVLILSLRVKLGYESILFPDLKIGGALELFIVMYMGVLASISFGLLISAIVPSMDVVLYAILAQLFVQIVLSATLFPLPPNPLSYITPGYWTMNAMGSSVDLKRLDDEATRCLLTPKMLDQIPGGAEITTDMVDCPSASAREANIENYKHESAHLVVALLALAAQAVIYLILTMVIQARTKIA